MRWYDLDPDVCMAISMIECSDYPKQIEFAQQIINLVIKKDKSMNYLKNATEYNIKHRYQRWYDKNSTISKAFVYLKSTAKELQKEISLEILDYINNLAA